jgi:addiction module HigA family antidote
MNHPGTVLDRQFMQPHDLSQYRVAVDIGVPPRRINEIVHGQRGITADTALRLGRYFGNEPSWWMALQADWDLHRAETALGARLSDEVKVFDPSVPRPSRGRPRGTRGETGPRGSAPARRGGAARRRDQGRGSEPEDRSHLFID